MRAINAGLCGVYMLRCEANGRVYIGATGCLLSRSAQHIADLNARKHKNSDLQSDWLTYGQSQFTFTLVKQIASKNDRFAYERKMITRELRRKVMLYNIWLPAKQKQAVSRKRKTISWLDAMKGRGPVRLLPKSELPNLVTLTEAAGIMQMSLNAFKYHVQKADAPVPVLVGENHIFFIRNHLADWLPTGQGRMVV